MQQDPEFKQRLTEVNRAIGLPPPTPEELAEISRRANDVIRQLVRHPVVHAWATKSGSQLQFWCRYCEKYHYHGRHMGSSYIDAENRWDEEHNWQPNPNAVLPLHAWRKYLSKFIGCRYNPNVPGGKGVCSCPFGCADGHRAAHCWREDSGYRRGGYILHEVHPNDERAHRKPRRGA